MECGQHQMAGEGRVYRDTRRLAISHLTDHDHVRVMTHHRAQESRESQANLRPDLNLIYPGDLVFNRILGGQDISIR